MTHSPAFDIAMAEICAGAAPGWTSLANCRHAANAQTTREGLDALSAGLAVQRDARNLSLLTPEREAVIAARMDRIDGGRR